MLTLLPRFVRQKDAHGYLGIDRNKFDAEVRPQLTEIPMGPRSIVFDRFDLDEWRDKEEARIARARREATRDRRLAAWYARYHRRAPWASEEAIRAIYLEARRLTLLTGKAHHVDHVIPLNGRIVSGLHVETNLQILTGSENCAKGNRYEAE